MARNKLCTKEILENGELVFNFQDGKTTTVNVDNLPANIKRHLMIHGAAQKIGDSYAGAKTVTEARENAQAVIALLQSGEWTSGRKGGGVPSDLIEALAFVQKVPVERAREVYNGLTDEQKKAVAGHPEVKQRVLAIKLEREKNKAKELAKSGGDTVDLQGLFK